MNKFLVLIIICLVTAFAVSTFVGFTNRNPDINDVAILAVSPTGVDYFADSIALALDGDVFYSNYTKVDDISKLSLIPNFDERIGSEEYLEQQPCSLITNSVFYSKTNEPIGLFLSDSQTLGKFKTNNLLDTVVAISYDNKVTFRSSVQGERIKHAIQTGPRLLKEGGYSKLSIKNDNFARRIVLASDYKSLYFIVFFDKNSLFSGPYLASLPKYLQAFAQTENIELTEAVNLDGGSASVFINDTISLREISPVGAFFCVKHD